MLTMLQKRVSQAIINIFETGSVLGDYSSTVVLPGDAGHLTYGRSQTTIASGNLYLLIAEYVDAHGAVEAGALRPYLAKLAARDLSLDHDETLKAALRRAGADPVMRTTQDDFFDRAYWAPALRAATSLRIMTPLGTAVIYDSHIHGSWKLIRDRTTEKHGTAEALGERPWVQAYIDERRAWFAGHSMEILHLSVRRMDTFKTLIAAGNWSLVPPFLVRGVEVSEAALNGVRPPPILRLGAKGEDVCKLQERLVAAGFDVKVDGNFGPRTAAAVRAFQESHHLTVDGVVGLRTWQAL